MRQVFSYLTSRYCGVENMRIPAVVVPELKFVNIELEIFLTDFWNVPTMPRLIMDQNPSMVFV